MNAQCIAYTEAGTVCRRPATILDEARGGMVCAQHAPPRIGWPFVRKVCPDCGCLVKHEPHSCGSHTHLGHLARGGKGRRRTR